MNTRHLVAAAMLLCLACASCSVEHTRFTLASPYSVDLHKKFVLVKENAEERTSSDFIAYLYYNVDEFNYYELIGRCIRKHDGDLMTNVRVKSSFIFFVIGFHSETTVTGDVWKMADDVRGQDLKALPELKEQYGNVYNGSSSERVNPSHR